MKEARSWVSVWYNNKNSNSAPLTFPGTVPTVQKTDKEITQVT